MGYTFFAVFPYEPTKKAFHCLGQNLVNEMCQQLYEIQEKNSFKFKMLHNNTYV